MDPVDNPSTRDMVIIWLQRLTPAERLGPFQIIDSLVWSYVHLGLVFDAQIFDFNPAYDTFAAHVTAHFQPLNGEEVLADCRYFAPLRPAGQPLPTLMPRLANFVVPQQPIQQPVRCTFASTGGYDDHMWRGMVDDHHQALGIILEYQASDNEAANDMLQTYKNAHPPEEIANDDELNRIRRDPVESKKYVKELFLAMVDFSDVIDRPQKVCLPKPSRKRAREEFERDAPADPGVRDNPQVTRVKNAPDIVLEALCWILLDAIIEAQRANITISPWQKIPIKRLYEPYPSFRDRLDVVLEALRESKAIIDNLMDTSMVRRLAATPRDNLGRKKANNKLNTKRNLQIKAGNVLLDQLKAESQAAASSPTQADEDEEQDDENGKQDDENEEHQQGGDYDMVEPYEQQPYQKVEEGEEEAYQQY